MLKTSSFFLSFFLSLSFGQVIGGIRKASKQSREYTIEIISNYSDICHVNKIEFTSRNSNYQIMVNYLNSIANPFLFAFKTHACN